MIAPQSVALFLLCVAVLCDAVPMDTGAQKILKFGLAIAAAAIVVIARWWT